MKLIQIKPYIAVACLAFLSIDRYTYRQERIYTPPLIRVLNSPSGDLWALRLARRLPPSCSAYRVAQKAPTNTSCATVCTVISNCSESLDKVCESRRFFSLASHRDNLGQLTIVFVLIAPHRLGSVFCVRTGREIDLPE